MRPKAREMTQHGGRLAGLRGETQPGEMFFLANLAAVALVLVTT